MQSEVSEETDKSASKVDEISFRNRYIYHLRDPMRPEEEIDHNNPGPFLCRGFYSSKYDNNTEFILWGPGCYGNGKPHILRVTEPPSQQTIEDNYNPFAAAYQLKPIDLSPSSFPSFNYTSEQLRNLGPCNVFDIPQPPTSRSNIVSVSHCRSQLRQRRKEVMLSMGPCHWSDEKRLLTAIRNGDTNTVACVLQSGADPNTFDSKKRTALHIAASQGYDVIVNHLLAARADPNRQDILGNAPLHLAVCHGDTKIVNLLLNYGADINQKDKVGRTPLCIVKSRLGTLRRDKSISTDKLIKECQMISDILKVHCARQPSSGAASGGDQSGLTVDSLCNMIENITTSEQVDEYADQMIEQMSQLCILNPRQAKKDTQPEYVLPIL